jgi:large conductance mechanosensitive channel
MKIVKEFKEFALKGNVIDLAVGVVIGAAFNSIVNSVVKDVIMPPIGLLLGRVDFKDLYINLSGGEYKTFAAAQEAGAVTINYGLFINSVIGFLITAWAIFMMVKIINRARRDQEKAPQKTETAKPCPFCFSIIHLQAKRCPNCTSEL